MGAEEKVTGGKAQRRMVELGFNGDCGALLVEAMWQNAADNMASQ